MNIWIFNHYAVGPRTSGGTRHYDMAKQLISRGHRVTIFASSFNHFSKEETVFQNNKKKYLQESINGVNFIWIKTPSYKNAVGRVRNIISYSLKSYLNAVKLLKLDKPDIIIGSSVHPLAAYVGYLISKKEECVFYFEERDLWPQTFIDFGKISKNNPLAIGLYKLESFFYRKSKRIIVLFDKAKHYVESRGVKREKIIYLPNGVDLANYENFKTSLETDKIFNGLENKFVTVYVGSHGIANNLEPIIELFYQLKNYPSLHLLMIGNGLEKEKLQKMAKHYNMNNVTFKDSIPKKLVPQVLNKADLSIISMKDSPLYKWGFSMNKLYDYMAAGLPIIMIANPSIVGDLSKVDGINAFVEKERLMKTIIDYSKNEKLIDSHGENLKMFVQDHYSWEKLIITLENYMDVDLKNKS